MKHGAELAWLYSAADVFVFPSRTDTFGLVLLEAMACGTPVAAYPVTGPLDVVTDPSAGVLDDDLRARRARGARLRPRRGPPLRRALLLGSGDAPVCDASAAANGVPGSTDEPVARRRLTTVSALSARATSRGERRTGDEQPGHRQEQRSASSTAALPRSLARFLSRCVSKLMRSIAASTLEFRSSTISTSTTVAINSTRSGGATGTMHASGTKHGGEQDLLPERALVTESERKPDSE